MIAWIVETLVATTLLMALVLVLRAPVRRAMDARFAYMLWALPALRMVLPPLPADSGVAGLDALLRPVLGRFQNTEMVGGVLSPDAVPAQALDHVVLRATLGNADRAADLVVMPPTLVDGAAPLALLAVGIWLTGAVLFAVIHIVRYHRFRRHMIARSKTTRTVAGGCVRVLESDAAGGPLAFGLIRKYVVFPRDFVERYDRAERDLALAHELCHHIRRDLWANWAALAMLAAHWFNPLAWRAFRAFRADQEMACDAEVLASRTPALRHAYGRAIVKSAHGRAVSAACHLHTINDVKGRLAMLSRIHETPRPRRLVGTAGLGLLTAAGLAVTASGIGATETAPVGNVHGSKGVEASAARLPVAPPAPAPEAPSLPPIAKQAPAPPIDQTAPLPQAPPPAAKPEGRATVRTIHVPNSAAAETMEANFPEVREAQCGPGDGTHSRIIETGSADNAVMLICTDRIEKMAKDAQAIAMQSKGLGLKSALAGLRAAFASIQAQSNLTDEQRADAMAGIEEGIAEVRAEMAERN